MKLLLDECVPKRLAIDLKGHEVKTVQEIGWTGIKNGELLKKAAAEFDVLMTVDQRLPDQQNLEKLTFGVLIVQTSSTRLKDLKRFIPDILEILSSGKFRGVKYVGR